VAFLANRKTLVSATVAILWLSFPIEVRIVTAGGKKLYLNFSNMFSFEVESGCQQIKSEKSSLV
jgi:hypothetical protein